MPRHKQVTTCRIGDFICKVRSIASVCEVCGAGEGTLTTDCPGTWVDTDRQQEVFETSLDYTDERGWHLAQDEDGTPTKRSPRFASTELPPASPRVDPRMTVAPSIDWARVDRTMSLQHALSQKAIAWVLADRTCADRSATLARTEDEASLLRGKLANFPPSALDQAERDLLAKLERDQIEFRIANQRAEKCDDEFRQAARRLVTGLEQGPVTGIPKDLGLPED